MAENKDSGSGDDANQNQGDQQNSEITKTLETLLTGFKVIEERFDAVESQQKALQGNKDRGVNQALEETKKLKEGFAGFREYVKKYGDDAEQRFEQDQTLQRLSELADNLEAAQKKTAEAEQTANADVVDPELLKKYGIDPQSPEYLTQVRGGLTGMDAAMAVLAKTPPPTIDPNQATGASGGAGGAGASATAQAILQAQFTAELNKKDHWTPTELHNVEEEYRKKGLPMD